MSNMLTCFACPPSTLLGCLKADARTESIPVILLTAKMSVIEVARAEPLPIAGMIAKPFEPINLVSQIAEILDW